MHRFGTLIIGGGIAGASLACSLAERGGGTGVTVVDIDVFGKYASSELNGGGVRSTFAEAINIKLSLASVQYYRQHAAKFDYRQRGYLWLYDEKLWEESRHFLPLWRAFGLMVSEMGPAELQRRFPILGGVAGVACATFTPQDGRLSPHRLRMHYLDHAQQGGVTLMDRWAVTEIVGERPPYRVKVMRVLPRGVRRTLGDFSAAGGDVLEIHADRVVNAAGPWAARVAAMYGRDLPVDPLPRQVFLLAPGGEAFESQPFFIDYAQEMYFRYYEKDGRSTVLVSWSDPDEISRIDFTQKGAGYYEKHVRPRLVRRVPTLSKAEVVGTWTGHYEMSADKFAVVGPVPGREGLFNYNGLSAHGVMQSRGIAEALAEHLSQGKWPAELNLDELSESRFERNGAVEKMYV